LNWKDDSLIKPATSDDGFKDDFAVSLFHEHLEDASFLYEQRLKLFENPEISWKNIGDFEERLKAHLNGLVIGGEPATDVCKQQANEGDFGELFTAVCVFCRLDRPNLILKILEKLDPKDLERTQSVIHALGYELPVAWQNKFIQLLPVCRPKDIPIIARAIGYQRLPAEKELLKALPEKKPEASSAILWALGRLRCQEARPLLLANHLKQQDELLCLPAAMALLRMGEPSVLNHCLQNANSQNWLIPLIGLSGNRASVPFLLKEASQDKVAPETVLALGLLGDMSAVERFLALLADPKLAESSSRALNLITGAEIYEAVFVPEEIDKDELFEEDRENFKQGQVPTRADGKPYGITITRLSQKPDDWNQWWSKNKSRFKPNIRYRNGKPYSPACLLDNLESEKSPRKIRQLAYEELVIRYSVDFYFETDMWVVQQKRTIAKYAEWIQTNGKRFREGEWYFAGQLMS
jgi:uncharacterized protein (TIGR02270 family)